MNGMFWGIHSHREAREANETAGQAERTARDARTQIQDLRTAVDRLLLVNRAMWEILAEATDLTDADLVQKVNEIDLRDGRLDGKLTTRVRECPSCRRTMYKGHRQCLYCGAPDPEPDPFETP